MIPVYQMFTHFMFEKNTRTYTHTKKTNNVLPYHSSIGMDHVMSESYKGTILQRYTSFVKFHGSQNMTMHFISKAML